MFAVVQPKLTGYQTCFTFRYGQMSPGFSLSFVFSVAGQSGSGEMTVINQIPFFNRTLFGEVLGSECVCSLVAIIKSAVSLPPQLPLAPKLPPCTGQQSEC